MNHDQLIPARARVAMKQSQQITVGVLAALVLLVTIGVSVSITESTPPNALVVADEDRRVYLSPPCMSRASIQALAAFESAPRIITISEARSKYHPETSCRDDGGFIGAHVTALRHALTIIGIMPPYESRWERDGSWKW